MMSEKRARNGKKLLTSGEDCVILHFTCRPDGFIFVRASAKAGLPYREATQAAAAAKFYKEVPNKWLLVQE